ncbi:MAG TPA: ribokinase [Kosmotogaceae bacterium]|nr:MAG: PfkB domain protein [Thermotogales bacterium 46_20]HAA84808.1 ribokinase [Kosmotogaceae bacterium]
MDVLTVTLNPALDRELIVENLEVDRLHRVKNPKYSVMQPGGKGVNVSIILSGLQVPSLAIGFIGGFIGTVVEERLREVSPLISTSFVHVEEETRENITIVDPINDTMTEINSVGPSITEEDLEMFMRRFRIGLKRSRIVVISGSAPPGVPDDFYATLSEEARAEGKVVIVEAVGPLFEKAVESGAVSIAKPDLRGAQELFGQELVELEDYQGAAEEIVSRGSLMAVVSFHIEGDVIATSEGTWLLSTKEQVERSHLLGTGDSLIAGAVHHLLITPDDYFGAAKHAMAAAIAESAYVEKMIITDEDVIRFEDFFTIKKLR